MSAQTHKNEIVYQDLSYLIVGVLLEVYKHLGSCYQEKYYQKAIAEEFKKQEINFKEQVPIPLKYKDTRIGAYFLDFLVDDKIILEIKKDKYFSRKNIEQLYSYLKAFDLKLGILANFTKQRLEYKRILNLY